MEVNNAREEVIIDTNVPLVAAERHEGMSPACVEECIDEIERVTNGHSKLVIDDDFEIINEYEKKIA